MKQRLLGNSLMGLGDKARQIGPPYYLINDTFTTNRSAGAVNGTDAEPGPGRRSALDTNGKITVASGKLTAATGGLANFDPSTVYSATCPRIAGRLLIAQMSYTAGRVMVGWLNNPTLTATLVNGARRAFVDFNGASSGTAPGTAGTRISFTSATATGYIVAIPLRASGAFYFIKGGAFTHWTLLNLDEGNVNPVLYPFVSSLGTTAVYTSDYLRVPSTPWLPTPLVSDGFSAWGTTDGLGHAEGIAGGLGSGGSGLAYSAVGTWQASGGVASASALSGGSAIAYANAGKADVLATVKLTRSGGDGGLLLRFADGNNFISCRHDGTNVILVKKVAGSNTTVQTTAATYVAGAELRVICEATKFRVYYNNAFIGSEQTISDAALQSATNHGLYTTNTGNTFDDLVIYARGTGGEYAALDNF